jgi:hypothetical protein
MLSEIFIIGLSVVLASLLLWGFKVLPKERWQVIGCLLSEKDPDGAWKGLNLTYYGFFNATAYLLAAVLFFILMGSLSVPVFGALAMLTAVLAICMPASKLIAFWVEGKANTFTVGGASFVGLITAPWIIQFINEEMGVRMDFNVPVLSVLAAIAIAYAVGEGIGRLACISFGCCYGKPLSACHPLLQSGDSGMLRISQRVPLHDLCRSSCLNTGLARPVRIFASGLPGNGQDYRVSGHGLALHFVCLSAAGLFPGRGGRNPGPHVGPARSLGSRRHPLL